MQSTPTSRAGCAGSKLQTWSHQHVVVGAREARQGAINVGEAEGPVVLAGAPKRDHKHLLLLVAGVEHLRQSGAREGGARQQGGGAGGDATTNAAVVG